MVATDLIVILAPLVVWGATELVKYILPKVSGWVIVTVIVPVLSLAAAYLAPLLGATDFWVQFGVGLLAVFINELKKQLTPPQT